MNTWKKIISFGLAALTLVGCGQSGATNSSQASDTETKSLVVGLDDTFAPMGFRDDAGNLVGFDVDLAAAVSQLTGLEFTFQPIDWAMKETELSSGNIDAIWNGYTITPEREEKVLFSDPYMDNAQIVIVAADSNIQTLDDLKDKVVATQTSSSAYDAIVASGIQASLKNQEIISYSSYNEVFTDLEVGRADAIVVDETLGRYYMKQKGLDSLRVLEENFGNESYGIGFRKEDTQLQESVNQALKTLKENGEYDKIYQKWFE